MPEKTIDLGILDLGLGWVHSCGITIKQPRKKSTLVTGRLRFDSLWMLSCISCDGTDDMRRPRQLSRIEPTPAKLHDLSRTSCVQQRTLELVIFMKR